MTAVAPGVPLALGVVAERFFPDAESVELVDGSAGLVKVDAGGESWGVRRWRDGTTIGRIAVLHEALRLAREAGIVVVPEVAAASGGALPDHPTVVGYESGLFDAQRWMPGRPAIRRPWIAVGEDESLALPGALPGQMALEAAAILARFHRETIGAVGVPGAPSSPPRGFGEAANRVWRQRLRELEPLAPRVPSVREWRAAARRAVSVALAGIEEAGTAGQAADVVVHASLWPSHVLAPPSGTGQVITGIVGWTDAIISSPLVDIAQLVVHFGGWTAENAEAVISAYHDVRPLGPTERRLLPAVAALDLAAQTGRLLRAGYADAVPLDQGARSLARNGAASMIRSLETLANVVEFGETQPPRQFRKWVHRTSPTTKPAKRRGDRKS